MVFEGLCAFKYHFIGEQSDKFAVRGFVVGRVYLYSENAVDVLYFSAVPCNFDCVTNGAFYLGCGSIKTFGYSRIKLFGN